MNLSSIFDSAEKKRKLSHIKNLIELATADGDLSSSELDIIYKIGYNNDLKPKELKRILERPNSIKFYPPKSSHEKINQLFDLVFVMLADGEIKQSEMSYCKLVAVRLGIDPRIIDSMIRHIGEKIMKGIAAEMIIGELLKKVKI